MDNILEALKFINVSDLNYQEWINVGMALKAEGYDCSVWDEWSRNDSRYKANECERKWATFGGSSNPITGGTIVQMAKTYGYTPHSFAGDGCLNWDDVIEYDGDGKICEFSYYITDTKFKIIEKKEIICNPGNGHNNDFNLLGRENRNNIHLQFEADNYKKYRESQEFDAFIPEIEELLMQKDMLIFGWGVDNDLIYVDYSFKRYNKNALDLNAIDIQRFYLDKKGKTRSLENVYFEMYSKEGSNSNKFHKALYDAKCTMLVAKKLEKIKHKSMKNLITSKGVNSFHNNNCIKNRLELKNHSNFDVEFKIYLDEYKENYKKYCETIEPFSTDEYIKMVESNESNKNKFLISQMLRKKPLEAIDVINEFIKKGYYFTSLISEADVIIGLSKYDIEHLKLVIDKIQVKTGEKDVLLLTKYDYMNSLNK